MELSELLEFVRAEDERLREHHPSADGDRVVLARTVKLSEELGEFCNEVLSHSLLQRESKLEPFDKRDVRDEFADVVITALLLAESMDIDTETALDEKVEAIEARYD